jgi:hypothetical protein
MSSKQEQDTTASEISAAPANEVAKLGEEPQQDDFALKLQVINYQHTAREGYVLTVVVTLNGKQIMRDRVTIDSLKSRELFSRGCTAALIRETGFGGDKDLYSLVVFMWTERVLLAEATLIDSTWGTKMQNALLLGPAAGRA